MSDHDFEHFRARFEALSDFIAEATASVQSGTLMEMGNLDQDVVSLCQEAKAAAPEIAAQVQPLIAEMITALDGLARELEAFKAKKQGAQKQGESGGD